MEIRLRLGQMLRAEKKRITTGLQALIIAAALVVVAVALHGMAMEAKTVAMDSLVADLDRAQPRASSAKHPEIYMLVAVERKVVRRAEQVALEQRGLQADQRPLTVLVALQTQVAAAAARPLVEQWAALAAAGL